MSENKWSEFQVEGGKHPLIGMALRFCREGFEVSMAIPRGGRFEVQDEDREPVVGSFRVFPDLPDSIDLNSQFLHLFVNGFVIDLEQTGGFSLVAPGLFQHLVKNLPFHGGDALLENFL